jgi:molybdopterin converting factor small subunit
MPKVSVSPPLRGPTGGEAVVEVAGTSVRACLEAVDALHPGFLALVVGPDGTVHKFLKVFLKGEQVESLDTLVAEGDEVEVMAAVGGG